MSSRNRELGNLILVGILGTAAFGSAWIGRHNTVSPRALVGVGIVAGMYLVAHFVTRFAAPLADPTLLPLAALLTAVGLTVNYRLDPADGRRQATWVALGVLTYAGVLLALRFDYRALERYKYLFGVSAIALLLLPSVPHLGQRVNGVRLWVRVGSYQFQPGEIAKIFLVLFLAGYLRDKREALAQGRMKDFGPLLAIWGAAMLVIVETNGIVIPVSGITRSTPPRMMNVCSASPKVSPAASSFEKPSCEISAIRIPRATKTMNTSRIAAAPINPSSWAMAE